MYYLVLKFVHGTSITTLLATYYTKKEASLHIEQTAPPHQDFTLWVQETQVGG